MIRQIIRYILQKEDLFLFMLRYLQIKFYMILMFISIVNCLIIIDVSIIYTHDLSPCCTMRKLSMYAIQTLLVALLNKIKIFNKLEIFKFSFTLFSISEIAI